MIIDGINLDELVHETGKVIFPNETKGRIAHIDADFLAYQCSYEKEGEEKSWDDMCYNAGVALDNIRRMSGSEKAILHITPHHSTKGGRFDTALLKEYQANRKDRDNKPRYLEKMREWLHKEHEAILHMDCEADDGMSAAQYKAIAAGDRKRSVICTKDKDLMMVPGLHMDWATGEIIDADNFGKIWIDDKGSVKKLRGYGSKFFWSQLLMGDTADNISGLPKLCLNGKVKGCGPMAAYALLTDTKSNKECFDIVTQLFRLCAAERPDLMVNWRDQSPISPDLAMVSEMKLVWMRRIKDNPNDVVAWLLENVT